MTGNTPFQVIMIILNHKAARARQGWRVRGGGYLRECEMEEARGS